MSEKDSKKIIDKVEELSKDDEIISLNDEYDRAELDKVSARNLGIEQGMIEGIKQTKIETARNMLNKNFSISDICDVTGLSKEEVESLKEA